MTTRYKGIKRRSVVDDVVEELTRDVISAQYLPGASLPTLRELAEAFGVSTPTIREALRILEARGLVEVRHGSGIYVLSPTEDEEIPWMLSAKDADEYAELLEARSIIEEQIVGLAATRRTAAELAQLEEIVARMENAPTDGGAFLAADLDFHTALAEAAHNRALLRTMLAIRGPLKRLMANRTLEALESPDGLRDAIADHRQIVEAVRSGAADNGSQALRSIVRRGARYLEHLRDESAVESLRLVSEGDEPAT